MGVTAINYELYTACRQDVDQSIRVRVVSTAILVQLERQ